MNINDKIKQILIDKNVTPSYFADEIGVQRSSISHILSGRNRPSFDIIQKIIRRFPELGYEWIMEEDTFSNPSTISRPSNQSFMHTGMNGTNSHREPVASLGTIRSQRTEIAPVSPPLALVSEQESSSVQPAIKKVERILIFYTDGSFREYTPTA